MSLKSLYLYDDFSTTIAVSGKWTTTNALTGVVSAGVMRIRPTTGYDGVSSTSRYDLTGSFLGFQLVQNCAKGAGSNTITLYAALNSTNFLAIYIEGGRTIGNAATVYLRESIGGTHTDATFTYDPAVHIWFRIREDAGTAYWETSVDGTTWTTRRSKTTTLNLTSVEASLEGGYWGAEAGTTFASIDNFNLWAGVPPPPTVPKMETLTDDFTASDTAKWAFWAGAIVTGGRLTIDATGEGNNCNSVDAYDFSDSYLAVELIQQPIGVDFYAEMGVRIDGGNFLQIQYSGGTLYFQDRLGGASVTGTGIPYSAVSHRWLRIRSVGTTITYETSRDGAAWTVQRTTTTAMNLTSLKAHFGSGDWAVGTTAATAIFDNVNLNSGTAIGETALPNPKTETLTDDFATADVDKWTTYSSGAVVIGGQLNLDCSTEGSNYNSTEVYDLTDSYIAVQAVQVAPNLGQCYSEMGLYYGSGASNFIQIHKEGNTLYFQHRLDGGVVSGSSVPYSATNHKWWRIRSVGTTITWETSSTGASWTIQRTFVTAIPLTAMQIHLGAGDWTTEALLGTAIFDDFNLITGTGIGEDNPKMETLTDDFAYQDTNKWGFDANASATGDVLRLDAVEGSYGGFTSVDPYDLTDSYMAFQMVQNQPEGNGTFTTSWGAQIDSNNKLQFTLEGGTNSSANLYFQEKLGGVTDSTSISYDPLQHKWFRIRSVGTTISWETSRDGSAWTVRRTKVTTLPLNALRAHGESGYYGTETVSGTFILDNFNLTSGTTIGEPNLPAELFTDDFTTTAAWYGSPGFTAINGQLVCAMSDTTGNGNYEYISTNTENWDLSNSYYACRLVQNFTRGAADYDSASFEFRADVTIVGNDDYLSFFIWASGLMVMREFIGGVRHDITTSYNASRDKWLRIRCAAGTAYWETSFNGVDWTIRASKGTAMVLTYTQAYFLGGCYDSADFAGMGTAIVDNLNLLPAATSSGWSVGAVMGGGYDGGGPIVSRNYFQAADWMWNPIPDNPVLDPDSETMGWYLTGAGDDPNGYSISFGYFGNAIVFPHQILPSTPRYKVKWIGWQLYPDWGWEESTDPHGGLLMPIPYGTQVPPGSDRHLCVMDPVQGKVFSLWQANYDSGTDTWIASYGGVSDMNGDGRDYIGSATATNISRAAGTIMLSEITAGEIPHALFTASNMTRPGANWQGPGDTGDSPPYVYPAQKSDGKNIANVPHQYTVMEGKRLQLNPALDLASIPGITPAELAIGTAYQRYGAYIGDSGGGSWPPTAGAGQFELWQGQDWTPYNEEVNTNPNFFPPVPPPLLAVGIQWDYFALSHIPWFGNIRVLKNWDGSA